MSFATISFSDWLAVIALVVAILSAAGTIGAWRVAHEALDYEKKRDRQLITADIQFTFGHRCAREPPGISFGTNAPFSYWLVVGVINNGETKEVLKSLKLRPADPAQPGEHKVSLQDILKDGRNLLSHEQYEAWVKTATLPESSSGYVAVAQLARGEPIVSGAVSLDQTVAAEARDKNAAAGLG